MNTGAYNALALMLSRFMGIQPGVQLRNPELPSSNGASSTDTAAALVEQNEFINTIVEITADDVCIGCNPFYLHGASEVLSPELITRYKRTVKALNKVAKWAAIDLLKRGFSVYIPHDCEVSVGTDENGEPIADKMLTLMPVTGVVKFYIDADGTLYTYVDDKLNKDALVFLNYTRDSLVPSKEDTGVDKEKYAYTVLPTPIQLNNVRGVATDLYMVERAIYRYRVQLSRIVRFAEVEAGVQLGNDGNSVAVENAAAAVNANSQSMDAVMLDPLMAYDDNLPIVPIHSTVGKISITSDIPDFSSIKELPDLEYTLNRLFLAMRFPKSYADFNTALSDTTVSLIRGDIRYSRMVDYTRSVMEETVNTHVFGPLFDATTAKTLIKLTSLPNSEDDDVVEALNNFQQFAQTAMEYIQEAENREDANIRLESVTVLLGDTANLSSIQKWCELMRSYIDTKFGDGTEVNPEEDGAGDEFGDEQLGEEGGLDASEEDDASTVNPDNEPAQDFGLPATQ